MDHKDAAARGADVNVVEVESGAIIDITMKTLYAFAITFIVSGHVITSGGNGGISFGFNVFPPASFHVACFVFVAGYFYRSRYEARPLEFLKKRVLRLLVPLYLINAVYGVWVAVSHGMGFTFGGELTLYNLLLDPLFGGHAFLWDLSLWFVAPLFLTELIDFSLRMLLRVGDNHRREIILIILYGAIGVATTTLCGPEGFPEMSSDPLVLLARTGFFLPCYAMGRIYKLFLAKHDTVPNWLYFSVVCGLQLVVFVICDGKVGYLVSWCQFYTGSIIPFVTTALGIAFWLRISRIVSPGLIGSKTAAAVADNTFSIMAHQFVGIFIVKGIFALAFACGICPDFDMGRFLTDFWYYYWPSNLGGPGPAAFGMLYVVAGIVVPVGIHQLWVCCKKAAFGIIERRNAE